MRSPACRPSAEPALVASENTKMASAMIDTPGDADAVQLPVRPLERQEILKALRLLKRGDFSVRLPDDLIGVDGEIAAVFNDIVELNDSITREFDRLSAVVGRDG